MNSNSVCVDASLAVAWLFDEQYSENADALRRGWSRRDVRMLVPSLFHPEVTSAIRQRVHFKNILPEDGEAAFSVYLDIPVRIIDRPEMYRKAWELAKKLNLPVCYDMQYLAVAELEDCEFWTADRKLAGLKNRVNRIRWIGEYRGT